jgi:SAM-dependent methyltransferase
MNGGRSQFWEQPEQVARFASREPDHRLVRLIEEYPDPSRVRALDLGCAGGRNTLFLAGKGFDVVAIDASAAMVAETRRRLTAIVGAEEAERRIVRGRMDRLPWPDGWFDLVVSLGVFHGAESRSEWDRALSEASRVLKSGGRLLASVFTPETDLTGEGIRRVSAEAPLYEGLPGGGRSFLVEPADLDREMARFGLYPAVATERAEGKVEVGRRVSANGLYLRRSSPPGS